MENNKHEKRKKRTGPETYGGEREGAGRPAFLKKGNPLKIFISSENNNLLNKFQQLTGAKKSDMVELALKAYLTKDNPDFEYCPNCHLPVVFLPIIGQTTGIMQCKCNSCNTIFNLTYSPD